MDEHISDKTIFCSTRYYQTNGMRENNIPLGKKEMYDNFIFNIEELCSSKSVIFDKRSNMNKTVYKVPIIGYFKHDIQSSYQFPMSTIDVDDANDEKFIMIRHKLYSVDKYYREVNLEYGELNIPKNYFDNIKLNETEKFYTSHKTSCAKDNITFSFHHDVKISSLVIKPEKMSFKCVHGDNTLSRYDRRNTQLMRKQKYSIKVLENEPGFISKFEMHYRSELTNGQWVKHGIYNGNVGIANTAPVDTLSVGGNAYVSSNITAGNLAATNLVINHISSDDSTFVFVEDGLEVHGDILTNGEISASGNVLTGGVVSASGNITTTANISGGFILGNGSFLTGIDATSIQNGTSNVRVTANGNVTVGIAGTSDVAVFASTGEYITGLLSVTGNVTAGNVTTSTVSSTSALTVASGSNGNILISADGTGIVKITGGAGFVVPVGNTAQRPSPVDSGTLRLNSTLNELEVYAAGSWQTVGISDYNQAIIRL
jgi:hypothetical protein